MAINVTPDVVFNGSDSFESTSFNIPMPAGITLGMLLVVSVWLNNPQTSLTSVSIAGWTQIPAAAGQTEFDKYFFFKVATSGDVAGGNWVCTCQDGFVEAWAGAGWSGVNTTTPFAAGPVANAGNATSFAFSSVTSPGTGSVWVGLAALDENSGTITDPASPVVKQSEGQFSGFDAAAIVYSAPVNSGAFAPSGTIAAGFEWATIGLFLNPGGSGPVTPGLGISNNRYHPGKGPGKGARGGRFHRTLMSTVTSATQTPVTAFASSGSASFASLTAAAAMTALAASGSFGSATLTGSGAATAFAASGSSGEASLGGSLPLSGFAASGSSGQALLTGTSALLAFASSGSAAQALLAGAGSLSSLAASGSSGEANLTGAGALTSLASSGSAAEALLSALSSGSISALASSGSAAFGPLSGSGALTAFAAAGSRAEGALLGALPLTAFAASGSSGEWNLTASVALSAFAASGSRGEGSLTGAGALLSFSASGSRSGGNLTGAAPMSAFAASGSAFGKPTLNVASLSAFAASGSYARAQPFISGTVMPNLVGLLLQEALQVLEQAGIINQSLLGYFGVYPVTAIWTPLAGRLINVDGEMSHLRRGVVSGQSLAAGLAVRVNQPITLNVNDFSTGVAFP